ncbi:hypothetical protein PPS11_07950 [Pseudomonas putida S11]|nr:hypothetical protein PPS11_07950 [Pseudomonas putida S11]
MGLFIQLADRKRRHKVVRLIAETAGGFVEVAVAAFQRFLYMAQLRDLADGVQVRFAWRLFPGG